MAAAIPTDARVAFRPSFFLVMTVVMALFIFSGFGLTYWLPMASGSLAPLPPVVHVHGAFFFSWMTLLVVQSILVSTRNVRLHMSLGTFGIALGTGVFLMGSLITIISQGASNLNPSPLSNSLAYLSSRTNPSGSPRRVREYSAAAVSAAAMAPADVPPMDRKR